MSQRVADLTKHKKSFENGHQIAWDSTSIELAQTCQRKYYYSMIEGLRPNNNSVHLIFGGLYATALEHFYKHRALGDDIDTALRKVVHETMTASWEYDENGESVGAVYFDDTKKTRLTLIRTIVWYVDQFAEETDDGISTYHLQSGEPAVELSFTLEASNDILLCGHLDRVVEYGAALYVMDQKTSGATIGTYYFNQFSPNNQMSLYTWAGQTILHSPVRGVIIDAAQIAVNFTRFERGITTRSKDQLNEWYESALYTIEVTRRNTDEDFWPMNLSACGNYGGCPFRSVCSSTPSIRQNYIKSDFAAHNWDPLVPR